MSNTCRASLTSNSIRLGLHKQGFGTEGIAKNNLSQKSNVDDVGFDFEFCSDALGSALFLTGVALGKEWLFSESSNNAK